jgi:hypothetical protein
VIHGRGVDARIVLWPLPVALLTVLLLTFVLLLAGARAALAATTSTVPPSSSATARVGGRMIRSTIHIVSKRPH